MVKLYYYKPEHRFHAITAGVPKRTSAGLLAKTKEHMDMVKATLERVKTYFKDKHVRYAAESM